MYYFVIYILQRVLHCFKYSSFRLKGVLEKPELLSPSTNHGNDISIDISCLFGNDRVMVIPHLYVVPNSKPLWQSIKYIVLSSYYHKEFITLKSRLVIALTAIKTCTIRCKIIAFNLSN